MVASAVGAHSDPRLDPQLRQVRGITEQMRVAITAVVLMLILTLCVLV